MFVPRAAFWAAFAIVVWLTGNLVAGEPLARRDYMPKMDALSKDNAPFSKEAGLRLSLYQQGKPFRDNVKAQP